MISYRYEVFFSVVANLSFSKAADDLFISQPAVSKHIKQLEADIGIALFVRKGNTILPTPTGQMLYEKMQQAKLIQREVQANFSMVKNNLEIRGDVKIGASTTISLYVMPKILAALHREIPNAKILLVNRNSENILKALESQEIDVACVEAIHPTNSVKYKPFMKDEIIPVCGAKSPYFQEDISLSELTQLPMALRERGSGTLDVLNTAFEAHGIKLAHLQVIARLGGTEALKNYLIEGEAIGFLSRLSVKKELESGELREVSVKGFRVVREFNFVMRTGEESTGLIKYLIKKAKSIYNG